MVNKITQKNRKQLLSVPLFKLFNLLSSRYRVAKRSSLKIAYSYFIPILIHLINSIRDAKLLSKLDIFIFSRFSQPFFFFFIFFFYFLKKEIDSHPLDACTLMMKNIKKIKKELHLYRCVISNFFFFFFFKE